jgi:hypothetical protein
MTGQEGNGVTTPASPRTLVDKIWDDHVVA